MPTDDTDAMREAMIRLYGCAPEQFLSVRAELVAEAKRQKQSIAARQIGALRRPTRAASVVNRWALHQPDGVDRLAGLYDRLRQAHDDLDAAALRDLSSERRGLVTETVQAAFELAGMEDPSTAMRDDVANTFDAAVADPETLAELGRLTKSRQWSGFGIALPSTGTPGLTLVHGGKDTPRARRAPGSASRSDPDPDTDEGPGSARPPHPAAGRNASDRADPRTSPERKAAEQQRRRLAQAHVKTTAAFEKADADLVAAQQAERIIAEQVTSLSSDLDNLQRTLDQATRELAKARREVKTLRGRRREARSALDRVERQLSD